MNLDELQSVQARERQSSDLQHLRSSFYREVGEFIQELMDERKRLVEASDDPFSSPDVRQLSNDIETAEQTIEAIYERRIGKVVKKASIAAAGMPVDDDGLTEEESAVFDDLVGRIEASRETVLAVLDGETPSVDSAGDGSIETDESNEPSSPAENVDAPETSSQPNSSPEADGISAADLMGGTDEAAESDSESPNSATESAPPDDRQNPQADSERTEASTSSTESESPAVEVPPDSGPPGDSSDATPEVASQTDDETDEADDAVGVSPTSSERDIPGIPRTTVRITANVGEVVGADNRDYDLDAEDVVKLPEPNADVLVENDAAERLE